MTIAEFVTSPMPNEALESKRKCCMYEVVRNHKCADDVGKTTEVSPRIIHLGFMLDSGSLGFQFLQFQAKLNCKR